MEAVKEFEERSLSRISDERIVKGNGTMKSIYHKPVTFQNVMKFTLPTIAMAVFQSLYTMVDGVFVANLVGTDALSALTLLTPLFSVLYAVSAMLSSGGSAVVMRKMGEGREQEAREDFTMLLLVNIMLGAAFTVIGLFFSGGLAGMFGASPAVTAYCREYLFYFMLFSIPQLLFSNLQIYVIASNSSGIAFVSSVFGGLTNVALDYLLISVFGMGMKGAALATGIGMLIPSLIIALYFMDKRQMLHFVRPRFRKRVLGKTVTNGISEMASNLVTGITMGIFNVTLLRLAGEDGVAASTIVFYVFSLMGALYMGYVYGIAPMFSYYYGEGNREKMKKLTGISLGFIGVVSVLTTAASIAGSELLVGIFTAPGSPVYDLAVAGNHMFSVSLLFIGFNTYASGLFTALSNGLISAVISLGRTCVCLTGALLLLPMLFGLNGIWMAVPAAELVTLLGASAMFLKYRKRYGY